MPDKPRIIIPADPDRWHRIDVFHYLGANGRRYACPPQNITWETVIEPGKLAEYERLRGTGKIYSPCHTGGRSTMVDNHRTR